MKRRKERQLELPFKQHGGRRPGAGRKPNGKRAMMSRKARAPLASRFPVHVTVRVGSWLPSLRRVAARRALVEAFRAGCERFGFRLTHYSIQSNHLHLIAEARDRRTLSRGMQGLLIRCAKALNRTWQRKGKVFDDRYHDRILRSPRQVRNALVYVLQNAKHHGVALGKKLDVFSSARWFDGWKRGVVLPIEDDRVRPVSRTHTWLLDVGWRIHGLIAATEGPRSPN